MAAVTYAPLPVRPLRRPAPRMYRRRRVLALAVVMTIAIALSWAVRTTLGGGSLTAPGRSAPTRTYLVQPGDTLWNVARGLHPQGDLRATVDHLAASHRGARLHPGERITLG
jgi:Tfp pilus assembly protein FimV